VSEAQRKLARLQALLAEMESVIVAYSGGVDSTFLMKVAHDTLGDRALAVTGVSASVPSADLAEVGRLAALVGAAHLMLNTDELKNPDYAANPTNRCYHCKTELYDKLLALAAERGYKVVVDGLNADDVADYRPGMVAAREHGVRSPLMEAGLTKAEIRELSQAMGLPTWDKPAAACLASRIPYGQRVTIEKLSQIDQAESFLKSLGYRQVRVRHHGEIARIELAADEIPRVFTAGHAEPIAARLKSLGFRYVTLDLQGYRSGSLNEGLQLIQVGTVAAAAPRQP